MRNLSLSLCLVVLAGCDSPPSKPGGSALPTPSPSASPSATAGSPLLAELYSQHNSQRLLNGKPPLTANAQLELAARKHAGWMAANDTMSHGGAGGSTFWDRITAEGYRPRSGGENVAYGYKTVTAVMNGWMGSPGHRANILGGYTQIGCGVAENRGVRYWCAVFATPTGGPRISWVDSEQHLPGPLIETPLDEQP